MTTPFIIHKKPCERGRIFRCLKCPSHDRYENEKAKFEKHFYRKHVGINQVPYYCDICKYVTTTQSDLEKHIIGNTFPTHRSIVDNKRMNGEIVEENIYLLMNLQYYHIIPDVDYVRLGKQASEQIFMSRSRIPELRESIQKENTLPATSPAVMFLQPTDSNNNNYLGSELVNTTNNSVLRNVMLNKKIPEIERSEVTETVDVLKGILDKENLQRQVDEFTRAEQTGTVQIVTTVERGVPIVNLKEPLVAEKLGNNVVSNANDFMSSGNAVNVVKNDPVPVVVNRAEQVADQDRDAGTDIKESEVMASLKVIGSDMKLVGSYLEVLNKELVNSHKTMINATQELTSAINRAFESLTEAIKGSTSSDGYRENRYRFNNRRQQYPYQQTKTHTRSPRHSRSGSPERRFKFMKF